MSEPQDVQAARIQRKRTAGWRAPAGAVYVGRGTRWGNPWRIVRHTDGTLGVVGDDLNDWTTCIGDTEAYKVAVERFRVWAESTVGYAARARAELAGRDLMCWCPDGDPCHADVLLDLANQHADGSPADGEERHA